ncbi:ribonuclease H-like domain-containing protein [Tanacetum coccineum]
MLENQENNKSKSDKGYHAVPPPFTGNFIPFKPDLTFMDEIVESENMDVITIVTPSNGKKVESNHESADVKNNGDAVEPKTVRKNSFRPPVIEDWNSDDDSEVEFIPNVENKTVRPSTEKIKFVKSARETPKQNKHYPRGNQRNWNNLMSQRLGSDFKMINKACFICGSFEHLHNVCDKKVIRLGWNNSSRVNHKNFANKMTHPHPNRKFVPQAVLTRVKDTTARDRAVVSENKGKGVNVVKASACWSNPQQKEYKERGVIDNDFLGCDNRTEFKNSIMNQFCKMKGIKSEFSVARTPQQNGVAKRKNRTLIEAARTMCPVTILNTRDHLGKFDGKVDERYFVGYSVVSKAMRVFNKRTRIVEETLNIRFLKNTPNVKGNRPDWLFDVDSLTISMNYVPVVAGNQTNGIAGTKDNIVVGHAQKEKDPEQEYILIPLCTTDPLISQGPRDSEGDAGIKPTEMDERGASDKNEKDAQDTRSDTHVTTAGPTFDNVVASPLVNTAGPSVSTTNAFKEHLFERFSPFKNAFTLPPVPNVSSMDNTGIFGNAYDDEDLEEEVDMNNVISSYSAMNEDYYHEQNSCYDPNSFVLTNFQPAQYTRRRKRIEEEESGKDRYWKIPVYYDDDDDEESSIPLKDIIISGLPSCVAITPVLFTEEPVDSLIMEDGISTLGLY